MENEPAPKEGANSGWVVSPKNGAKMRKGRPRGTPNRVTASIRDAVEIACREVTDSAGAKGLAAWLLERANGTIQDRQIFAGLVAKALPLTIKHDGAGLTINLGWLAGRDIRGTVTAQTDANALISLDNQRTIKPHSIIEAQLIQEENEQTPIPLLSGGGEGA